MTRRTRALLAIAALVAVGAAVAAGSPSSGAAGTAVTFADPAGDATGLDPLPPPAPFVLESTPRPSEPDFDIVNVTMRSDGSKVMVIATMGAVGPSATSLGATFRWWFSFGGAPFQVIAQRPDGAATNGVSSGVFARTREPRSAELTCRECTVKYDTKASTVTLTLAVTSLTSIVKQATPSAKLAKGSTLTELSFVAQRIVAPLDRPTDVARTATVDVGRAPAGAALTL